MGGYLVFKSVVVPTAPEVEGVSYENARRWHVVDGVQIVAWSRGYVFPIIRLRGVHERACASRGAEEENHAEGAPVAAAVIAAFSSGSVSTVAGVGPPGWLPLPGSSLLSGASHVSNKSGASHKPLFVYFLFPLLL